MMTPWYDALSRAERSDRLTAAGSPQGPDPRPGRSRARLNLLLAVALLLGALSPFAAAPAGAQAPAAPTSRMAEADGSGRLYISWTAPTGTLSGYGAHYTSAPATGSGAVSNSAAASGTNPATARVAASRGTESSPPAANHRFTGGLNDGTAYRVRVRAKNTKGAGTWAFTTGTPEPSVPFEPVNVVVTADHTALRVSWDRNPDGDAPTSYRVHYTASATVHANAGAGTNPATHLVKHGPISRA